MNQNFIHKCLTTSFVVATLALVGSPALADNEVAHHYPGQLCQVDGFRLLSSPIIPTTFGAFVLDSTRARRVTCPIVTSEFTEYDIEDSTGAVTEQQIFYDAVTASVNVLDLSPTESVTCQIVACSSRALTDADCDFSDPRSTPAGSSTTGRLLSLSLNDYDSRFDVLTLRCTVPAMAGTAQSGILNYSIEEND
jgi:hypothetical protein